MIPMELSLRGVCVYKSALWFLTMTSWIIISNCLFSMALYSPPYILSSVYLTPRREQMWKPQWLPSTSHSWPLLFSPSHHHVFINTFSISLRSGLWSPALFLHPEFLFPILSLLCCCAAWRCLLAPTFLPAYLCSPFSGKCRPWLCSEFSFCV